MNMQTMITIAGKCLLSVGATYFEKNTLHFSLPEGQYIISLINQEQNKSVRLSLAR
jgi:hypothetical protein